MAAVVGRFRLWGSYARQSRRRFVAKTGIATEQIPLCDVRWHKRSRSRGTQRVSDKPLILVVEDEYPLQGVVEEALEDGGFAADILSSGEEALTLFRSGSKDYKALVADVNLKGMSGWDVAMQIREREPTFPIVYMTGASADQWGAKGVPNSILLQKPFAPAQLITALSQLLNTGPST
jgi:CheY-like chemotaxis protein